MDLLNYKLSKKQFSFIELFSINNSMILNYLNF